MRAPDNIFTCAKVCVPRIDDLTTKREWTMGNVSELWYQDATKPKVEVSYFSNSTAKLKWAKNRPHDYSSNNTFRKSLNNYQDQSIYTVMRAYGNIFTWAKVCVPRIDDLTTKRECTMGNISKLWSQDATKPKIKICKIIPIEWTHLFMNKDLTRTKTGTNY